MRSSWKVWSRDGHGLLLLLLTGCGRVDSVASPSAAPAVIAQARVASASPLGTAGERSRSGVPASSNTQAPELERLRSELDFALKEQLLPFWYPRTLSSRGGFVQNISSDGRLQDDGSRFLVFQSRMTWVAAEAARRYPELRAEYLTYARHGLDFLRTKLWDQAGGFYFELGTDGKPALEKHTYGIAFGIYASAAVARATGDVADAALAVRAFEWLDDHAHDSKHGGYFEALTRSGAPILSAPKPGQKDGIGTEYGRKSMNAHIHVLEALTELYRVAPSERLRARLHEVFLIVRDRITAPAGYFHVYLLPDYRPVTKDAKDSYGHNIEGVFLLLEAAEVLGMPADAATLTVAAKLVDHALARGWDTQHGGLFNEGRAGGEAEDLQKVWWVQAETLNGLLALAALSSRPGSRYLEVFQKQWTFVRQHVIASEHGEWRGYLQRDGSSADAQQALASKWKAAYHTGRALMYGSEMLARMARRNETL
jgi:cellobiose epimerase